MIDPRHYIGCFDYGKNSLALGKTQRLDSIIGHDGGYLISSSQLDDKFGIDEPQNEFFTVHLRLLCALSCIGAPLDLALAFPGFKDTGFVKINHCSVVSCLYR